MQQHAPAKLNLSLHVTGKRADGYHLLESLVVFTQFGDVLRATPAETLRLTVTGEFAADVGADAENLVLKAAHALRRAANVTSGAALTLEKNIPVGAGLGGGSADAAATLKLLMKHWAVILPNPRLNALALALGADVPMCLASRPLIARGIGEEITPLAAKLPPLPLVLVYPRVPIATADIFAQYALETPPVTPALDMTTAETLMDGLVGTRNQLQRTAVMLTPEVAEVLLALNTALQARFVRMTGSGSACFAITEDKPAAERLARDLRAQYPHWWVLATETMA
jgi:4-diphosphocytidyl-2-C-methyl-D-erythritol kinase